MRRLGRGAVAGVVGMAFAVPAPALAGQSLQVTSPTGFPAGGDPTYTTTTTLDTSAGTPSTVTIAEAPGVLASANANPACVTGTPQYTLACQIGQGSASTAVPALAFSFKAFLVPPPGSADVAGIDLVTDLPGGAVTHAGAQLVQTPSGNVQTVLIVDLTSLGIEAQFITGMSVTVDGKLDGKPFTRMPTRCTPGSSALTVVYANRTETTNASPDFIPTGCSSLPYDPQLSGTAVLDSGDRNATVTTTVTQGANEAASASNSLILPWPTLSPNAASLALQNTSKPVGTATSVSPLLPAPLKGSVYFTGTFASPTLTIKLPPPAALTLVGSVDLPHHSVTFSHVPDVPVTRLTVMLFGGPNGLQAADCGHPTGPLTGAFVGQNGKTSTVTQPLVLSGCPGPPRVAAASLTGLSAGKPAIRLRLVKGNLAPELKTFSLSLPRGLGLERRGLRRGIHVSGARTIRIHGRTLVITLGAPAPGITARFSWPALSESPQLKRQARRHHRRGLRLAVAITDAHGAITTYSVRV